MHRHSFPQARDIRRTLGGSVSPDAMCLGTEGSSHRGADLSCCPVTPPHPTCHLQSRKKPAALRSVNRKFRRTNRRDAAHWVKEQLTHTTQPSIHQRTTSPSDRRRLCSARRASLATRAPPRTENGSRHGRTDAIPLRRACPSPSPPAGANPAADGQPLRGRQHNRLQRRAVRGSSG